MIKYEIHRILHEELSINNMQKRFKDIMKTSLELNKLILLVLFFTVNNTHADEVRCIIEDENEISVEYTNFGDSTNIDILFPKVKTAKLKFVRLRYGKPREMFVKIPHEEVENGYISWLTLNRTHEPVEITAIYHFNSCYGLIETTIENSTVKQTPNAY